MAQPSQPENPKKTDRNPEEYSEVIRKAKGYKSGALAAFMVTPKDVYFETQEDGEQILLLLRKHFITNLKWIFFFILALIAPIIFSYIPAFLLLPVNFQIVTLAFWYLLTFGFALEQFLSWYFHVYIITDERIIDYDFYSLLYKRVSKAKIDRIEDVTFQMGGLLQNMFHYGNVYIQTAGEMREFDFESVPMPEQVGKLLNELMLEEERENLEGRAN